MVNARWEMMARLLHHKGIDVNNRQLSSDDFLNAAVHEDEEAAYVGPFDPMFVRHIERRNDYLNAAELVENRNREI